MKYNDIFECRKMLYIVVGTAVMENEVNENVAEVKQKALELRKAGVKALEILNDIENIQKED